MKKFFNLNPCKFYKVNFKKFCNIKNSNNENPTDKMNAGAKETSTKSESKIKLSPFFKKFYKICFKRDTLEELCYNPTALRNFRELYIEGKYQQIITEHGNLNFIERRDPYINHIKYLAATELEKKINLIRGTLTPRTFTTFDKLIILSLLGLVAYMTYKYYSNFGNLTSGEDQPKEEGNSIFKILDPEANFEVTFAKNIEERLDNVKGIDEVKEEIEQLIRMIKNPQKYVDAGAKLHKGILLCGKPGTGKTLIARAIAGESGVNFIFLTGSDFDEVFVGVGAGRIRKLFQMARKSKPCIIFIDEIDSLLAKSRRMSMEHSSSRATINQFLAEMDGFEKMEQVFLIGATNHEKDLDSAAVRPGRFDKKIHINVPDEEGRVDIIQHYINQIKLAHDKLDPKFIARMTPGFTGAEIENLVNLSIISAVTNKSEEVSISDIGEARDRILMGISRKRFNASDRRRYLTSLHEGGHTLVCYRNPICQRKLHKLTIIPRGPAEGVTFTLHDEEALNSKEEFISEIDMAMGGHVAEELMYGNEMMTAGCSSDLNKATQVAQMMVKKLGMYGEKAGYIYIEDKDMYNTEKVSETYKQSIDETVKVILKESHDRVYNLLKKEANELKNLAQAVFQYDTIDIGDIKNVLEGHPDLIKTPQVRKEYSGKDVVYQGEKTDEETEKNYN